MLKPLASVLRTGDPHATVDRLFRSQHVKDLQVITATTLVGLFVVFLTDVALAILSVERTYATYKGTHSFHFWLVLLAVFLASFTSLAPVLAICGAILTWAYQVGCARLGVVDLFACEISTLCKVATIVDTVRRYVDRFNQPPAEVAGAGGLHMPAHQFTSQENYFPVFENCTRDLQTLEATVVINITEFYTFMKSVRDSLRTLTETRHQPPDLKAPFNQPPPVGSWHEAARNVVYMMFLGLESARQAVGELVEFEPEQTERTIVILISELEAYSFLISQFKDPEDMRHKRLILREADYRHLVPVLCDSVKAGTIGAAAESQELRAWERAMQLLPELQRRYQSFLRIQQ
jgi:hypothetical protein